jgi:hypothetical protein
MAGKNVKPAAKGKGGSGEVMKRNDSTAAPKVAADQAPKPGLQEQIDTKQETAGAAQLDSQVVTNRHVMIDLTELRASVAHSSSTGNQEQPGTLAAGSDVGAEQEQPGAAPNCFADSSLKSTPGLAVTSSRDGFWRGGRQWTKAKTIIRLSELTDEQADQLMNEPMLTVAYVEDVLLEEGA